MSFYIKHRGKLACVGAAMITYIGVSSGEPIIFVLLTPGIAGFASVVLIELFCWYKQRWLSDVRGVGQWKQWGFCGDTVRGVVDDDGQIWISVKDCQHASGVELLGRLLHSVPVSEKREHPTLGYLLSQPGMVRVLDSVRGPDTSIHRFRLFLEREVWRTRKG